MKKEDKKAVIVLVLILIVLAGYVLSNPGVLSTKSENKEDLVGMAGEPVVIKGEDLHLSKQPPVGTIIKTPSGNIFLYKGINKGVITYIPLTKDKNTGNYVTNEGGISIKSKEVGEGTKLAKLCGSKGCTVLGVASIHILGVTADLTYKPDPSKIPQEFYPKEESAKEVETEKPAEIGKIPQEKKTDTSEETKETSEPTPPPEDTTPELKPAQKLSAAESTAKVEALQEKVYAQDTKSLTVVNPDETTTTFTKTGTAWVDDSGNSYDDTDVAAAIGKGLSLGYYTTVQLETISGTDTVSGGELTFVTLPPPIVMESETQTVAADLVLSQPKAEPREAEGETAKGKSGIETIIEGPEPVEPKGFFAKAKELFDKLLHPKESSEEEEVLAKPNDVEGASETVEPEDEEEQGTFFGSLWNEVTNFFSYGDKTPQSSEGSTAVSERTDESEPEPSETDEKSTDGESDTSSALNPSTGEPTPKTETPVLPVASTIEPASTGTPTQSGGETTLLVATAETAETPSPPIVVSVQPSRPAEGEQKVEAKPAESTSTVKAPSLDNALEDMDESIVDSTIEIDGLIYKKEADNKWTAKPVQGGTHTLDDQQVAQKCKDDLCNIQLKFGKQKKTYSYDPEVEAAEVEAKQKKEYQTNILLQVLAGLYEPDDGIIVTYNQKDDRIIYKIKNGKTTTTYEAGSDREIYKCVDGECTKCYDCQIYSQEGKAVLKDGTGATHVVGTKTASEIKNEAEEKVEAQAVAQIEKPTDETSPKSPPPAKNFDDQINSLDTAAEDSTAVVNDVIYTKNNKGEWVDTTNADHKLTDQQMKRKCADNNCKLNVINTDDSITITTTENDKPKLEMPKAVGDDGSVTYTVGSGDEQLTYKVAPGTNDVQICKDDKCEKCDKCTVKDDKLFGPDEKKIGDSPELAREKAEDYCVKNLDDEKCGYVAEGLKNAVNIATAPFRAEVERVVGSYVNNLLDLMWIGSNRNFLMAMCGAKYYEKEGESVGALGGAIDSWKTPVGYGMQDPVDAIYDGLLSGKSNIIKMSGTKEEVTPEMYRYTARVLLIGNFEYTIYLKNSCTGETSAFEGGFVKQGAVQAHGAPDYNIDQYSDYYSGSLTTFDCNNGPCRFNQICVKINQEDSCNTLTKGKFRTKFKDGKADETGSVEC